MGQIPHKPKNTWSANLFFSFPELQVFHLYRGDKKYLPQKFVVRIKGDHLWLCTQHNVRFLIRSVAVSFVQKPEWLLEVSWFYQLKSLSTCILAVQEEHLQHAAWGLEDLAFDN